MQRQSSESYLQRNFKIRHLCRTSTTRGAHRSKKITYPSSGNNSAFTYDPFGRMVKIVETVASTMTSTKQHIWCSNNRCEERDGSGSQSKQFFSRGQINSGMNYFYAKDHLGSVRTMTDNNGDAQAAYSFDPFGRANRLEGGQDSDFQFAGYYAHGRSGLNLTVARAYSPGLGRFINRDPIAERGGLNLFTYSRSNPVSFVDPSGTYFMWWPCPRKDSDRPDPDLGQFGSGTRNIRILAQISDPFTGETMEQQGDDRKADSWSESADRPFHSTDNRGFWDLESEYPDSSQHQGEPPADIPEDLPSAQIPEYRPDLLPESGNAIRAIEWVEYWTNHPDDGGHPDPPNWILDLLINRSET